jgi:hypothetical protein
VEVEEEAEVGQMKAEGGRGRQSGGRGRKTERGRRWRREAEGG